MREHVEEKRTRRAVSLRKSVALLGVVLCLSLAPRLSRAQGEPPPVLDPADVFTDAVEVVETLPMLNADNEARMLWYFDPAANAWQGFAYPEGVEEINSPFDIVSRSDGTYAINASRFSFEIADIYELWVFDPRTGEITHPEAACGQIKALPGEGEWIIYQNPQTELFHLCFTETGQLTSPLPESLQPRLCSHYDVRPTALSPDNQWVVFSDCEPLYSLYALEISTNELHYLGTGEEAESVHIAHWLDNEAFIVNSSINRNDEYRYLYFADASEQESVRLIGSQWVYDPQYFENPRRYIWISEGEIYEYNLDTRTQREISYSPCDLANCEQIAVPNAPDPSLIAILDGHPMGDIKQLIIVDVATGQIIYTSTFSGWFGSGNDDTFVWLDEDTFVLTETLFKSSIFANSARSVSVGYNRIDELSFYYLFSANTLSPDKRFILIWSQYPETSLAVSKIDLSRGIMESIIKSLDANIYDLNLRWQEDNSLLVNILDNQRSDPFTLGCWLVRVP